MGGLFTVLAVIAAGAASVYFITSPMGMRLIRKKSVSTILKRGASPTRIFASGPTSRDLLFSGGGKSPTEYVAY